MKNKKELFNKLSSLKINDIEKLGLEKSEIEYIKTKLLNDKIGLKLNYKEYDLNLENNYMLLKEIPELGINVKQDKPNNLLIEGDNYYALKALQAAGTKVDIIYIDPPYNTGKEFIYNDDFSNDPKPVSADEPHKHSKWLSFMKRRLELARDLLSEEGVIFVSIDDNEQAYLKVLMDEIFGENNFISNLPRKLRNGGKNDSLFFRKNIDYILIYAKNIKEVDIIAQELQDANYVKEDNHVKIRGKYQTASLDAKLQYSKSGDYPFEFKGKTYYPGGEKKYKERQENGAKSSDYTWRWSKKLMEFAKDNDFIEISGNKIRSKVYFNSRIHKDDSNYKISNIKRTINPQQSYFTDSIQYSTQFGSDMLKRLGVSFDAPKSTSLVKGLIKLFSKNGTIILDFFAGSGTTGQAVMELNEEDNGTRRFILVTNNEMKEVDTIRYPEKGIARSITRERIFRAINGKGSKNEKIDWKYSDDKKSLVNNSMAYLKVENLHKANGEFEEVDKVKPLFKREFNKDIDIIDLRTQEKND